MIYIDILIIVLLILGFIEGWNKGLLTSAIKFLSAILIFLIAFLLKTPISAILIKYFPFISFNGIFAGISSLNIILYEAIAYTIAVAILSLIFKIVLNLSGILNKVLNATIILGLPNKIGGALINVIRYYIMIFIIIFVLSMIPNTSTSIQKSTISNRILNKTPILSNATKNINNSLNEIYNLFKEIDENSESTTINQESLEILLKYGIIDKETAIKLYESGKLEIEDFDSLIKEYGGE